MTWFRVGGAGIPASLKNAMNAIFNKKFGTSGQDYPPNQWPADVNLMGPLPEGTASGPVANFSDGADDVPTKNVIATIAPTLSGVSTIMETQTGKNLLEVTGSAVSGDITVTPQADGTVVVNGQRSTAFTWSAGQFVAKEACSIVFSGCSGGSASTYSINIQKNNVYQADVYSGDSVAYNLVQGDVIKFIIVVRANVSMSNVVFSPMIRFSIDTDGTFEKYTETTYIANLGRTIYGGSADLVNGTGTEKNSAPLTFDGSEDWRADTTRNGVYLLFSTMGTQTYGDGICNMFTTIKAGSGLNSLGICFGVNNYAIYIPHLFDGSIPEVTDVATWQTYLSSHDCTISYPLATQIDFTFDGQEINSLYGVNNFWNDDEGDTTVVYRRDIDLALQAVSSSRGLMMASRPVTQLIGEQADLDQVNELNEEAENTEEQEGDNDAR